MKRVNDFDGVACFYDLLARLVFGNTIIEASSHYLSKLSAGDSILIVGGGTGKILKDIPAGVNVDYVEYSAQMLKRSQRYSREEIRFIQGDFFEVELKGNYDYVVFPFFLDLFSDEKIRKAIYKVRLLLKPSGKLIVTDFQSTHHFFQKLLISSMILFFRVSARMESKRLESIMEILSEEKFVEEDGHLWKRGMIFSSIFRP